MHRRFLYCLAALLLPWLASASPLRAAGAFWEAYARGDMASAAAAWHPKRVERFRAVHARETAITCMRVFDASLHQAASTTVYVDAVVERRGIEAEHYAIDLRAAGEDWKVVAFERREDLLAAELVNLSGGERAMRLEASPELINPRLAIALGKSAVLLSSRNRPADAVAILEVARGVAEAAGSDVARAAVLAAESVHWRRAAADDARAVATAEEAERIALRAGDPDAIGNARTRLARAVEPEDPARAEALLLAVMESADALHDPTILAIAASQLAWMHDDRLEHAKAFRYALAASHYAELSGDPSARLNAALNLAGAYEYSGDAELTRFHYERAAAVARESGAVATELFTLNKVAELVSPGGERELLARANELAGCLVDEGRAAVFPILNVSARAALQTQDLPAARRHVDAAYALASRSATDLRFRAELCAIEAQLLVAEGRPFEALLSIEEARAIVTSRADWRYEQTLSAPLARALVLLGRPEEAILALRDGITIVERERATLPADPRARQSFFARRSDLFDELVALLVAAGRNAEALDVAERRTARTLRDFAEAGGPAAGAASAEIEAAQRAVVELNRAIFSARPGDRSLARKQEQLAAARLHLDDLRTRQAAFAEVPVPDDVPETLDLTRLPPDAGVLRYFVAGDRTTVFVISRRGGRVSVASRTISVRRDELTARVGSLLDRIESRDLGYRDAARALHRLLVAPMLGELRGVERLTIVPDGPLWALPFHALVDPRGAYLLRRFEIHYAPSVSWCLRDSVPVRGQPRSILALGDPEVGGAGQAMVRALVPGRTLGRLPDAAWEAREVARLYPKSRVLTGRAADESALRSHVAGHDIIHLATHALIDEAQPLYSSLVLAPRGPDDGLLEARELPSLALDAGLFVLSACSTARGRSYDGEGVVGLAWALLSSGVPQVVVSQWNADSKATARLMVAFHRALAAGHSAASALRKAQLELSGDVRYEDPLYWAAFVLLGS